MGIMVSVHGRPAPLRSYLWSSRNRQWKTGVGKSVHTGEGEKGRGKKRRRRRGKRRRERGKEDGVREGEGGRELG